MTTLIARSLRALQNSLPRLNNLKLGMVPTMGSLHNGHIELIRKARKASDTLVVTIFVNPLQFNRTEDFESYPYSEVEDIKKLKELLVDIIFIPKKEDVYPLDFSTYIKLEKFNNVLCASKRKNHFNGVATILTKFFFLIRPDLAFFGEKDFQQLIIVKKIVKDLFIKTKIIAVKTVRDKNGLALSSRNQLLSSVQYKKAKNIYKILKKAKKSRFSYYEKLLSTICADLRKIGVNRIDYVDIRDEVYLKSFKEFKNEEKKKFRIFVAVYIGKVRLIDNIRIN